MEEERIHHRDGVHGPHYMTARALSEWAARVAEAHVPNPEMPDAVVRIDGGLWLSWETEGDAPK